MMAVKRGLLRTLLRSRSHFRPELRGSDWRRRWKQSRPSGGELPPMMRGAAWTPDEGNTWFTLPGVTGYWAVAFASPKAGWLVEY